MPMTVNDLVGALVKKHEDVGKAVIKNIVQDVFAAIIQSVAAGDEVLIAGFGVFSRKARGARDGTNPQTQEKIHIAASYGPNFRARPLFREEVRNRGVPPAEAKIQHRA